MGGTPDKDRDHARGIAGRLAAFVGLLMFCLLLWAAAGWALRWLMTL